jgi:hypothetical protein
MDTHKKENAPLGTQWVDDVKSIIYQARQQVYSAINSAMVQAYWLIGQRIVE